MILNFPYIIPFTVCYEKRQTKFFHKNNLHTHRAMKGELWVQDRLGQPRGRTSHNLIPPAWQWSPCIIHTSNDCAELAYIAPRFGHHLLSFLWLLWLWRLMWGQIWSQIYPISSTLSLEGKEQMYMISWYQRPFSLPIAPYLSRHVTLDYEIQRCPERAPEKII